MISYTQGNLLEADAEALVNAVNTVGVMGKGIALMFKQAFPANFKAYAAACKAGEVEIGRMFVTERPAVERPERTGPRWIVNLPTKQHWRHPSQIDWIDAGLHDLQRVIREHDIRSIAIPPLGCGLGGLPWPLVRDRIARFAIELENVRVIVYAPAGGAGGVG